MFNTYEANATVSLIAWFSYHTRHQIQHAQSHMETETMIILWAVSHKRYPHISDVFSTGWAALLLTHTSVNDSFNQTLTRSTHHAISQHIPFVFDGSLLRENQLSHAPDQRKKERKQSGPQRDVSVAFISQQETFKACWANVRGGSETRGHKSGAVSSRPGSM